MGRAGVGSGLEKEKGERKEEEGFEEQRTRQTLVARAKLDARPSRVHTLCKYILT